MRRAVFLDRDGVVNRAVLREGKPYPPADAFRPAPAARRPRSLPQAARGRIRADSDHQPAGYRARHWSRPSRSPK